MVYAIRIKKLGNGYHSLWYDKKRAKEYAKRLNKEYPDMGYAVKEVNNIIQSAPIWWDSNRKQVKLSDSVGFISIN